MNTEPVADKILALERPHPSLWTYYVISAIFTGPGIIFTLPYLYFRYQTLRYRFDDEGISMKVGILFRKEVNLTYARIQDIHLRSGIIQRWLGLANLEIQTASGSATAEMMIEGFKEYEAIRDFLYTRMRGYHAHGKAIPSAPAPPASAAGGDAEVVSLLLGIRDELRRTRELLEAGNSVPPPLPPAMYSAFRQFCERLLRIPTEPEPPPGDEAKTQIFCAAPNFYKYLLALWALKTLASFVVILLFFIGPVIALVADHSKHNGSGMTVIFIIEGIAFVLAIIGAIFRLALVRLDFEKRWYVVTDRSLRVREGIVQVREAPVTFANIQNISISQGPIQRALGIADLRVDTAGGGGGSAQGKHQLHNLHTTWFRGVNNANEIRELMQLRLRHLKDAGLGDHEEQLAAQSPGAVSSGIVAALREVRAEAAALCEAAGRRAKTAT